MKSLIVEDDASSRKMLQYILSEYGEADVAEDGKQAVEMFLKALEENNPYNLVTLDILLPKIGGQKVLSSIRLLENKKGFKGLDGTKIIMTTILNDAKMIMQSFSGQCDSYIVKPVSKEALIEEIYKLGLWDKKKMAV
jgi:two-component system chemotaxis response regulator CheY